MSITSVIVPGEEEKNCSFGILTNSKFVKDLKEAQAFPAENLKETVYRHDGVSVDKVIEYHPETGKKIKVTNYDYFDDTKVKSIEDYDVESGAKLKVTSFSLFKSITDFDINSGKKIKTTNFDIKNETKKTSVYDFDLESEKIVRITLFRPDENSVSLVKELDPKTGMVKRCVNYKKNSTAISSVSQYEFQGDKTIKTTFFYNTPIYFASNQALTRKVVADTLNKKILDENQKNKVNKLIDDLYKNKLSFSSVAIS